MTSSEFLESHKSDLENLGYQLNKEALFAQRFLDGGNPQNEKEWFGSVRSICIYGTFLIKNVLDNLDTYKEMPDEQLGFYIGKIAIQPFLDIVNAFEQSTNKLISQNRILEGQLSKRMEKKLQLIDKNWSQDTERKSKKLKSDIIRIFKRKALEMQFVRDTMSQEGVIDDLDKKILEFAWDIRNSMHSNYVAIKDINFSAPGTSLNYSFSFKKGEELYHPNDLVSFHSMTVQIIFIQVKVLQHYNKKINESSST